MQILFPSNNILHLRSSFACVSLYSKQIENQNDILLIFNHFDSPSDLESSINCYPRRTTNASTDPITSGQDFSSPSGSDSTSGSIADSIGGHVIPFGGDFEINIKVDFTKFVEGRFKKRESKMRLKTKVVV